jgi:DNA-directed RNA polymerase subunit RPC12/RpoP
MITVSSFVAPLIMFFSAMVIGAIFSLFPIKPPQRKPIPLVVFAMIAGILAFVLAAWFSDAVYSFWLFQNFASLFDGIGIALIQNNTQLVALVILVAALELGLAAGFTIVFKLDTKRKLEAAPQKAVAQNGTGNQLAAQLDQIGSSAPVPLNAADDEISVAEEQALRRDEQSMMELFLYGKVHQIVPTVDPTKPEGYIYEGIPQLDWDTKHSRQVLDALVRKGYLTAELTDKVIVCNTCGSGNIRIRKTCPECSSLRLHKEALIEHFACGAVERQSAFETKTGDLVCPKCKAKLNLIGSDYRMLPPAYKCANCSSLNSEPQLIIKCDDCGATAHIDDEPEIFLYKYTANPQLPLKELQQIKPIDTCAKYFKSQGYSIVAPAFVSGRSGTQHLFDMLVLGRVGWVDADSTGKSTKKPDNGNTAVEVVISGKPVKLEEITRIYGKISDIDSDFILFVIPGLTPSARNYAEAYGMKVSEGKNIEEALANSKIPKVNDGAEKP